MPIATATASLSKSLPAVVSSRTAAWLCSLSVSLLFLLAPALWNGFPIVFHDTGGYIERVIQMNLGYGRSFFYGLFLWLSSLGWWSFWGPVALQALAAVWLVHLMLRCHGLASGPVTVAASVALLSLVTGISWYAAQLMPDILVPYTVLGLWLLGFRWQYLSRPERLLLAAIALLGMLSHMSCLALGIGLAAVTVLAKAVLSRRRDLTVRVMPAVATVMAAALVMPLVHFLLVGQAVYTPGGPVFIFARFVQDGLAQKYLGQYCPIEGVKLCALQDRLPKTADEFLWTGDSPFKALGDWEGAKDELGFLVRECLKAYPGEAILSSFHLMAQQLVLVATGDGLDAYHHHARGVFASLPQRVADAYRMARQQQDEITQALFDGLNRIHRPTALLSIFGLVLVVVWGSRKKQGDLVVLGTFVFLSLLGNAFICGALSNPHDRYQSRLVWLATLVIIMAALRLRQPGSCNKGGLRELGDEDGQVSG